MKEYDVIIPREVYRDIDEVVFYKQELGVYQKNIERFVEEIYLGFKKLETHPKTGHNLSTRVTVPTKIRYFVIQDYLMFYEITSEDTVSVISVVSAKTNWMNTLF